MFENCFLKRRAYSANGLTAPRPIGIDSSFTAASSSFKHAHDHCSRSSEDATPESHKTPGLFSKQQVLKILKKGYTVDRLGLRLHLAPTRKYLVLFLYRKRKQPTALKISTTRHLSPAVATQLDRPARQLARYQICAYSQNYLLL